MRSSVPGLVVPPHVCSQSRPADERDPVLSRGALEPRTRSCRKVRLFYRIFSLREEKGVRCHRLVSSLARLKRRKQRSNEGGGTF
ncbi:hypothetical protein CEXT_426291 [Caerostris extrusa]|uniref:Uncharacterized protein n=1 Tax=Caerostris extrusa TaxID=172846 RepID=A0AAV4SUG3_CAEEX|nr:hypothetical protein CEXT_426291 [Caerostris extrusa]